MIDPFTSTSLPSTMSFLNIIPESNDEMIRSERNSIICPSMRPTEGTLEINLEDVPTGITPHDIKEENER